MRYLMFFLLILLSTNFAHAKDLQRYILAIGTYEKDPNYFKSRCIQLQIAIARASNDVADTSCVWLKDNAVMPEELSKKISTKDYSYMLELREFKNKIDLLRFVNLHPEDEADFHQVGWNIKRQADLTNLATQLLSKSFNSLNHIAELKTLMVAVAQEQSKKVKVGPGSFVHKEMMADITPHQAYEIFISENKKNKDYIRTGVEIAIALGFGGWNYYLSKNEMKVDWDFPTLSDSLQSKLNGAAYSFDDNAFVVNRNHSFAGMIYYQIARNNGLNTMESFLVDLAGSTIWETVIEYREVVSINDQVVTTFGGFVIGEALIQISNYLRSPGQNLFKRTVSDFLNPTRKMSSMWDGFFDKKRFDPGLEFNRSQLGRVEIGALYKVRNESAASPKKNSQGGFIQGEVISIPNYEEPGNIREILKSTTYSDLFFGGSFKDGIDEYILLSKIAFAAYHEKKLGRDGNGDLVGFNFWVGPASAVSFTDEYTQSNNDKSRDFEGTVHVLGTMMRITGYKNGFKLTTELEIYGDFSMIRSFQIEAYKDKHGSDGLYDVLANKNYYYAVGSTTRGQIILEYDNWEAGVGLSHTGLNNVDALYRNQNLVTNHLDLSDYKDKAEAFVSYKITKNFGVRFVVQRVRRGGSIKGFADGSRQETKYYGQMYYIM